MTTRALYVGVAVPCRAVRAPLTGLPLISREGECARAATRARAGRVYLGELQRMAAGVVAVDGAEELVRGGHEGAERRQRRRRRRQGGVAPGGVAHDGGGGPMIRGGGL